MGFPGDTVVKNLPANAGDARDPSSVPESGRSPGVGNVNPLQYSCLDNPMNEEPGGLQYIGSQRVRHNCVIECACARAHTHTIYIASYKECSSTT